MTAFKYLIAVFLLSPYSILVGQTKELTRSFPLASPEQQGISSATLDSMLRFIMNTKQNLHHLTIIRNNQTIFDTDIYPYSSNHLHDIASVTKSITALLIGIGIDKGFIKNEDQPVLQFFPEIKHHDRILDSLTIKDLVTMTSGFACGPTDGEKALSDMGKVMTGCNSFLNCPSFHNQEKNFPIVVAISTS